MESNARLRSIQERFLAASPAPWTLEKTSVGAAYIRTGQRNGENRLFIRRDFEPAAEDDVRFIAEARNTIPRLTEILETDNLNLLTGDELNYLAELEAHASTGPWKPFIEPIGGCSVIWVGLEEDSADMYVWLGNDIASPPDIRFIAHAREDLPFLIREVRHRLQDRKLG